ncbi:MAG: radical SAM protein [Clostridia bacterium]|nr:radical SAM protein [Clostridia bacterium]
MADFLEKAPLIANVQHFSLGDGPGIRTTVFFKGCNLHCPWCHNPETIPLTPTEMTYERVGVTEICGKRLSVDTLFSEIMEDADFYAESGGGVTFSGGEVLLQADSAAALARKIKERGLHLIVDTAGCVPYSAFQKLNPYVDEYYLDYKSANAMRLKAQVGADVTLITKNLSRLIAEGKKVRVRIPLIPAFNTEEGEIEGIASALIPLGITHVDVLPFHHLGKSKYTALKKTYAYENTPLLTQEEENEIVRILEKHFTVKVEKH